MRVRRIDDWLRSFDYPELERVDAPLHLGRKDVLVICAGFEDRAIEALRRAVADGSRSFRVLCVDYLPAVPANQTAEAIRICEEAGATIDVIQFDREQPAGAARRLLEGVRPETELYIDLSGMSRLLIVQLVATIVRSGRTSRTQILYCTAGEYPPTRQQVGAKLAESTDLVGVTMFLSSGIFGLTIVPELSSVAMQGQPMRVVAFPSWNTTQLAAVCAEMQASYFTIVHGLPPKPQNAWRRDAIRSINRVDSLPPRDEVDASTLDYRETVRILLDVYAAHSQREKLVISPTGSKMQSLAVGLVCGFMRDVQVVYPTPRTFAAPGDYTRGVEELHRLPLDIFDSARELPAWQFVQAG